MQKIIFKIFPIHPKVRPDLCDGLSRTNAALLDDAVALAIEADVEEPLPDIRQALQETKRTGFLMRDNEVTLRLNSKLGMGTRSGSCPVGQD